VNRRALITLLGGAAVWPMAARGQQGERMRRIGVLMNAAATETVPQAYVAAFAQGLRQLGWTEGQNLRVDVRWNAGDAQLARIYAAQLIGLMPDAILTASTTSLTIIQQATSTVPVVFVQVSDPVEQGFVSNAAKPGGNLTGFSLFEFSIGGKWLNLLKEIAPELAHVGVVFNPNTSPQSKFFMRSVEAAASSLGVRATTVPVRSTDDIEPAFKSFAQQPNGGLIFPTDTFIRLRNALLADLASAHRLPEISAFPEFAAEGGLTPPRVTQRADHTMNVGDRLAGATPASVIVPPPERVMSAEPSAAVPIAKAWPARSRRSPSAVSNPTIRSLPEPARNT
jgi:ABC-type uncharacterized transport system substrate-binding protein